MIHAETRRRGGVSFAVPSAAPAANHVPAASDFTVSLTRDGCKTRRLSPRLRASARTKSSSSYLWNIPPSFFRSEEHTSELQSLMRISYAVFCLKKKTKLLQ